MTKLQEATAVFAKKLKKLMKDKGVSGNKLSQDIGIDRASITKYLSGESSPRLDTFLAICSAFNVQPNYFLNPEYEDYSADESKTEERKIIESLYCLCKHGYIDSYHDYDCFGSSPDYSLRIYKNRTTISTILDECIRFAGSELSDDFTMCKKIADKYESALIEEFENMEND